MSQHGRPVDPAYVEYLTARTRPEDDLLRRLRAAADAAGIPDISITAAQASFLQVLLRVAGAHEVVEVGTLAGYAAIAMARALPPGGRVRTLEIDAEHAAFARRWIAASDVGGRVEVLEGDARETLRGLAGGSADAMFIDADKEGYVTYLEQALRIVRDGGLVIADNAFAFGQLLDEHPRDAGVAAVRAFNDRIAAEPRLHSVIVPLGDGLWVGVKTG